ncbi:MAG: lipid A export permease/ATP-binding protein MsbA [Proteobacteria bacterium]|nr:lipid A export permease/ATP-binding protein MsbA [Pseudomonadota bacterium]
MTAATPAVTLRERIRRIAPYFSGTQAALVVVAIATAIGSATDAAIPALMKTFFDNGLKATWPLWLIPIVLLSLAAIRGLAGFVAEYGLAWSANRGMLAMRTAMFQRLLDAEPALFTRESASSLTNTLTYEVQNGANQLVYSLLSVLRDSLTMVALVFYLIWLNWQLTLFVVVVLPAVAFTMRVLSKRLHRLTIASRAATDELAYVVEENVLAWRVVRLHGAEAAQARRFGQVSNALRRLSIKAVAAASTMTPLTQMLAMASLSAVLVVAMWQSRTQGASMGDLVGFITAMLLLISPIKHLSEAAGPITRSLVALERGVDLIDSTPGERGGGYDGGRARGEVELSGVSLRYGSDGAAALDGVTLHVAVGESVALVGPSGAGKTTLVNLLPRFLEPTEGAICLDGRPLREWNMSALRRQFALVSQDVVLFNDSLAANVALGAEADRERVRAALAAANLLDFAEGLPQGLDTPVGHNGSQLSGGQRQRLAIARAIFKDAPILILDEATSALDSESERLVQSALETLMKGRTSLVIAHRLSTIERADRIVALEGGRIVEQGSHAELLAHGGLYARLHALQFRS